MPLLTPTSPLRDRHAVWAKRLESRRRDGAQLAENAVYYQDQLRENGVPVHQNVEVPKKGTNFHATTPGLFRPLFSGEGVRMGEVTALRFPTYLYDVASRAVSRQLLDVPDVLLYALLMPGTPAQHLAQAHEVLTTAQLVRLDAALVEADHDFAAARKDAQALAFCRVAENNWLLHTTEAVLLGALRRHVPYLCVETEPYPIGFWSAVGVGDHQRYGVFDFDGVQVDGWDKRHQHHLTPPERELVNNAVLTRNRAAKLALLSV